MEKLLDSLISLVNSNQLYKKNKKFYNIDLNNGNIFISMFLLFLLKPNFKITEKEENFIIQSLDFIDLNILIYPNVLFFDSLINYKIINQENDILTKDIFLLNYHPVYTNNKKYYPLSYLDTIYSLIFKFQDYPFTNLINVLKSEIQDVKKISKKNLSNLLMFYNDKNKQLFLSLYQTYKSSKFLFSDFQREIKILSNFDNICQYEKNNNFPIIETDKNNLNFLKINEKFLKTLSKYKEKKEFINFSSDLNTDLKKFPDYGLFSYVHLDVRYNQNQLLDNKEDSKYKYIGLIINKSFIEKFKENHKITVNSFDEKESKFNMLYNGLSYVNEFKDLSIYDFKKMLLNNEKINISVIFELENNYIHNITVFKNKENIFVFDSAAKYNNVYMMTKENNEFLSFFFKSVFTDFYNNNKVLTNRDLNIQVLHDEEITNNRKNKTKNKCYYYCMFFSQYIIKNNIELTEENYFKVVYEFFKLLNSYNSQTLIINNCLVYFMIQAVKENKKTVNSNLTDILNLSFYGYDTDKILDFFIFMANNI